MLSKIKKLLACTRHCLGDAHTFWKTLVVSLDNKVCSKALINASKHTAGISFKEKINKCITKATTW